MRLSNLRAFIPTRNATAFDPSGGKFRLSGHDPIYDVHGCGGTLSVDLPDIVTRLASTPITARGERLTFSVTSVEAGQTVILRRPGRPDLKETFAEQGILLDAPVKANSMSVASLKNGNRTIELDVDFVPREFCDDGVSVASIAGVRLCKPGEKGDCRLRLID